MKRSILQRAFSIDHNRWLGVHNPFGGVLGKAKDPHINLRTLVRLCQHEQEAVRQQAEDNIMGRDIDHILRLPNEYANDPVIVRALLGKLDDPQCKDNIIARIAEFSTNRAIQEACVKHPNIISSRGLVASTQDNKWFELAAKLVFTLTPRNMLVGRNESEEWDPNELGGNYLPVGGYVHRTENIYGYSDADIAYALNLIEGKPFMQIIGIISEIWKSADSTPTNQVGVEQVVFTKVLSKRMCEKLFDSLTDVRKEHISALFNKEIEPDVLLAALKHIRVSRSDKIRLVVGIFWKYIVRTTNQITLKTGTPYEIGSPGVGYRTYRDDEVRRTTTFFIPAIYMPFLLIEDAAFKGEVVAEIRKSNVLLAEALLAGNDSCSQAADSNEQVLVEKNDY